MNRNLTSELNPDFSDAISTTPMGLQFLAVTTVNHFTKRFLSQIVFNGWAGQSSALHCFLLQFIFVYYFYRDYATRHHLLNVYTCLSLGMLCASAGSFTYMHLNFQVKLSQDDRLIQEINKILVLPTQQLSEYRLQKP